MKRLIVLSVLVLTTSAGASMLIYQPNGFCRVTSRQEVAKSGGPKGRSLIVCRTETEDQTGDKTPEVVETVFTLKRNGTVDYCTVNVLDVTRNRHQAISIKPCGSPDGAFLE